MAKRFTRIEPAHRDFITRQHMFFTASAAVGAEVNVSPRSATAFRIIDDTTVAYLDLTGSGNETAAHLKAGGRLTLMFCAVEGPPMILRLYGQARVCHRASADYMEVLRTQFDNEAPAGARQIIRLAVETVQTSCGFGVPLFAYAGERETLKRWAEAKGPDGIETYWREKNVRSNDGLPTGLFDEANGLDEPSS